MGQGIVIVVIVFLKQFKVQKTSVDGYIKKNKMRHITSHLVKTLDVGANQNLFGGRMLEWLDEAGAIYTRKLCPGNFVTLKIGEVIFKKPIKENHVIDFYVDHLTTGRSSVNFNVVVECQKDQVLTAEMTFVHIGANDQKEYFSLFDFNLDDFREAVYNNAKKYYNADERKYHNIFHINNLIDQLNRLPEAVLEPGTDAYRELYLAICYHDAVYVPWTEDNEERSAALFQADFSHYQGELSVAKLNHVAELIRSTKIGFPKEKLLKIKHADLLHDLDYLGFADWSAMVANNARIEFEYLGETPSKKQRQAFKDGQKAFLTGLLNHPIFFSRPFKHFNRIAQTNIKKYLYDGIK